MFTYDVTIGRNVGTTPMTDIVWDVFQRDVLDTMVTASHWIESAGHEATVEAWNHGTGIWQGEGEESVHFQLRATVELDDHSLADLKRQLTELARIYDQDAIAFITGRSELL